MTPQELMLHVEEYNERQQQHRDDLLTAAYLSAYWGRCKRMPQLKKLLGPSKPQKIKQQTPERMLAAVKMLQAQFDAGEED